MKYNQIEDKKPIYKIKAPLFEHLKQYSRLEKLPLTYESMLHFEDLIPLEDDKGNKTLWFAVMYNREEITALNLALVQIYQMLVSAGDHIPYLKIDRIDFCSFGNSKPFRVRVINEINDNYDYFYVKRADASRIYGLELEEIFSPDKVNYLVDKDTLVEDHVIGIPADEFILKNRGVEIENRMRLAKEFVKFNERCFVRLLGDMRAYNFVVEITQDFDNIQYRLRAMDFDQQSFEGRKNIYKPQFYKDNIALVNLAQEVMGKDVSDQYQRIERVAMRKRYFSARQRTKNLLRKMKKDRISTAENIRTLTSDLAKHHKDTSFLEMKTMGDILNKHLELSLGIEILSKAVT
jgi:hypothetical protein